MEVRRMLVALGILAAALLVQSSLSGCLVGWVKFHVVVPEISAEAVRLNPDGSAQPLTTVEEPVSRGLVERKDRKRIPELKTYQFQDHQIAVRATLRADGILIILKNRTEDSMRILWSESRVDMGEGEEQLVRMGPEKDEPAEDRQIPQSDSVIPAGGELYQGAFPLSMIVWKEDKYTEPGGEWRYRKTMLGIHHPTDPDKAEQIAGEVKGRKAIVWLPLQFEDERVEYRLILTVTDTAVVEEVRLTA